jgi:alpha(1,3/1,4) fucosyltransferase
VVSRHVEKNALGHFNDLNMQTIKVKFDQLYKGFNTSDNFFTCHLSAKYKVEISDDPEYYFFTHPVYGSKNYLKYKCHRIFIGGENIRADWNICDYVLDSDFYQNNPRQKRWPLWAYWGLERINQPKSFNNSNDKKKFCCMVVSNPKCKERNEFFHELSKYRKVDSGGQFLNNIGFLVENKMEFIKDYKFVIAFENSSFPGYTTEKLIEPFIVNSIPIYWGNPVVDKDFNTNSFINIKDASEFDNAINKIIELDNDDEKYLAMRNEPCFFNNEIPGEFSNESICEFFDFIIEDSKLKRPVATIKMKKFKHDMSVFKDRVMNKLNTLALRIN